MQRRQAYLGRRVTSTWNWAGITSSRSFAIGLEHMATQWLTILADPGHLPTAAGAQGTCGLDHALDPGQVGRQMPAVARRLAGPLPTRPGKRGLGFLLRCFEHTLGQLGIFQRQIELVGRQLLGALAELRALRRAQDVLQPAVRLLYLGQRRLDLGQAGLQMGVLAAEGVGIHVPE